MKHGRLSCRGGCRHLTHGERCRTSAPRKSGLSDPAIARQLGRDRTTVWREIRRNGGGRGYRHGQAQAKASARRGAASSVAGKMTRERWRAVEDRLAEGWSPDRTAGRFRKEGIPMAGRERICQHVRADRKAGGPALPVPAPPRARSRTGRAGATRAGAASRTARTSPSARRSWRRRSGSAAGRRTRSSARATAARWRAGGPGVELHASCKGLGRRTAAAAGAALLEMLLPLAALARTITADNGKEFAGHAWVARALGAGFLFATPCHSWERGLNGHANGLVRGCFSRDTDSGRSQTRRRGRPGPDGRASGEGARLHGPGRGVPEGAASLTGAVPDRVPEGPVRGETRGVCGPPTSVGLRARCGNGRCCTSEWKWGKESVAFGPAANVTETRTVISVSSSSGTIRTEPRGNGSVDLERNAINW